MLDDNIYSQALTLHNQEIDIYNNSWGPPNLIVLGPGPLLLDALKDGVVNGRQGLGCIYVFTAGNAGEMPSNDNSNNNGYANSRYTIAVAASTNYGEHAGYSEEGANILINAPSNGGSLDITTTDRTGTSGYDPGNYTSTFGGTSAAAPLVSGIIALMLEANPDLTWREVQHILIRTAFQNDPDDEGWSINGAGYHVNHKYGFGRIDALAAIDTALAWTPLNPEILTEGSSQPNLAIPDNDPMGVSDDITISDEMTVEYVEIYFTSDHPWGMTDLEITLISPGGTESILSERQQGVQGGSEAGLYTYNNWSFGSVRHYGETSQGVWTLEVKDIWELADGIFEFWGLKIYGRSENGNNAPELADGAVNPTSGDPSTDFTYTVRYNDEDGDIPAERDVFIDGSGHSMILTGGSESNGTYTYTTTLSAGSHEYYFSFTDGNGGTARFPASGSNSGPTVNTSNNAPELADGTVNPTSGDPSTDFMYTVRYNDEDGDIPAERDVFIDGSGHSMSLTGGSESNGTYTYTTTLSAGSHEYYFSFTDGNGGTARFPGVDILHGPSVSIPASQDSDNDGVPDNQDQCPGTPPGENVDSGGCSASQRDTDGDGVTDDKDQCPGTSPGTQVDGNGCPIVINDSDNDGVADNEDVAPDDPDVWSRPDQPFIISPAVNAVDVGLAPVLRLSDFIDQDGNGHDKTEWNIFNDEELCVFHAISGSFLTSLPLPDYILEIDTVYYLTARFFDDHGIASQWSASQLFITPSEDPDDTNNNGIPDIQEIQGYVDLDHDGIDDIDEADIQCVNTVVGDRQLAVKKSTNCTCIGCLKSIDPDTISDAENKPEYIPFGLISFKIGVENPGDMAEVNVYLSESAPSNASWYTCDGIYGWREYEHVSFNADRTMITLQLRDGDLSYGDMDGVKNGFIVDPSGLGMETPIAPEGQDGNGGDDGICFISVSSFSIMSDITAIVFLGMGLVGVLFYIRMRGNANRVFAHRLSRI